MIGSWQFWAAWTIGGFILACILLHLDGRREKAGLFTGLAILLGGPIPWACWAAFTIAAHRKSRRSPLAQLERELRSKPKS